MAVFTDGTNLYATHIAELHEFANKIGLASCFFVQDGLIACYYIGGGNIALLKAMAHGAQCIDSNQLTFKQRPVPHAA